MANTKTQSPLEALVVDLGKVDYALKTGLGCCRSYECGRRESIYDMSLVVGVNESREMCSKHTAFYRDIENWGPDCIRELTREYFLERRESLLAEIKRLEREYQDNPERAVLAEGSADALRSRLRLVKSA